MAFENKQSMPQKYIKDADGNVIESPHRKAYQERLDRGRQIRWGGKPFDNLSMTHRRRPVDGGGDPMQPTRSFMAKDKAQVLLLRSRLAQGAAQGDRAHELEMQGGKQQFEGQQGDLERQSKEGIATAGNLSREGIATGREQSNAARLESQLASREKIATSGSASKEQIAASGNESKEQIAGVKKAEAEAKDTAKAQEALDEKIFDLDKKIAVGGAGGADATLSEKEKAEMEWHKKHRERLVAKRDAMQPAVPLPADQSQWEVGKIYINSNGQKARWNGKEFEVVG